MYIAWNFKHFDNCFIKINLFLTEIWSNNSFCLWSSKRIILLFFSGLPKPLLSGPEIWEIQNGDLTDVIIIKGNNQPRKKPLGFTSPVNRQNSMCIHVFTIPDKRLRSQHSTFCSVASSLRWQTLCELIHSPWAKDLAYFFSSWGYSLQNQSPL